MANHPVPRIIGYVVDVMFKDLPVDANIDKVFDFFSICSICSIPMRWRMQGKACAQNLKLAKTMNLPSGGSGELFVWTKNSKVPWASKPTPVMVKNGLRQERLFAVSFVSVQQVISPFSV